MEKNKVEFKIRKGLEAELSIWGCSVRGFYTLMGGAIIATIFCMVALITALDSGNWMLCGLEILLSFLGLLGLKSVQTKGKKKSRLQFKKVESTITNRDLLNVLDC